MSYNNNHYISRFILNRFSNKLDIYNIKTKTITYKRSTLSSFVAKDMYPVDLEKKMGVLESKIANLLDNKILNDRDKIILTKVDVWLIKKFFMITMIRNPISFKYTSKELTGIDKLKVLGYKEVTIENETKEEYMFRTLNVLLDSNSIKDVYNNPYITYEACQWATLFNNCNISIWDSKDSKEDFVISDVGMVCEHDKSRFKTFNINNVSYTNKCDEMIKAGYIVEKCFKNYSSKLYNDLRNQMTHVQANYYMFAVSNTRTIALVNPFYSIAQEAHDDGVWPTLLSLDTMKCVNIFKNDILECDVKYLTLKDVIFINIMLLDRVNEFLGYVESNNIKRSLNVYSLIGNNLKFNDYTPLINELKDLGYDFPKTNKYVELSSEACRQIFTTKEIELINMFYIMFVKQQK